MKTLLNALTRLFYRYRISLLEGEKKTIDRVLHETDIDLLSIRLRRSELLIELSQAKAKYRSLAKPFEKTITPKEAA